MYLQDDVPHPIAILIPAGSVVRVAGAAKTVGVEKVEWEGATVQVFAVDLRDRGELMKALSATRGAK